MMQYRTGRRKPKLAPRLKFEQFWTGKMPAHPASVDHLSRITSWDMYGNDNFGDCVAAGMGHYTRISTGGLGQEIHPTLEQVYALYRTQNPGFVPNPADPVEDNGMDMQTMLEYVHAHGWPTPDRKILAFAAVDVKNLDAVKAAEAIFGGVLLGCFVEQANMDEFDKGLPWDYVPRSLDEGGHCIASAKYLGKARSDVGFVTWAQVTTMTDRYWQHKMEEAWLIVEPENLGTVQWQQGIDEAKLKAAYKAITHSRFPA